MLVNFLMEKEMEKVTFSLKTVINTLVNSKMEINSDRVQLFTIMVINMLVNMRIMNFMAKGNIPLQMVVNMFGIFVMVIIRDKANLLILMERFILDNG